MRYRTIVDHSRLTAHFSFVPNPASQISPTRPFNEAVEEYLLFAQRAITQTEWQSRLAGILPSLSAATS